MPSGRIPNGILLILDALPFEESAGPLLLLSALDLRYRVTENV